MGGGPCGGPWQPTDPNPVVARLGTPGAQISTLNLVTWGRNSHTDLFSYTSENKDLIRCPCLVDIAELLIPHKPVSLLQRGTQWHRLTPDVTQE